jgi:hypothetical protein
VQTKKGSPHPTQTTAATDTLLFSTQYHFYFLFVLSSLSIIMKC